MFGQCSLGVSNLNRGRRDLVARLEQELYPYRRQLLACEPDIHGFLLRQETPRNLWDDIAEEIPLGYLLYRVVDVSGTRAKTAEIADLASIEDNSEYIRGRLMASFGQWCTRNGWDVETHDPNRLHAPVRETRRMSMDFDWIPL